MPREQTQEYWLAESIREFRFEDYYTLGTELGKGATSVVYKCEHKGTHQPWAVKIINKRVEKKVIQTEIGILLKLDHENVIRLKEVFETPAQIYLVLELVKGGELFDRIVSRGCYSEKDAAKAVNDMLKAVAYLHRNEVVHRDLKPENLLYEDSRDESLLKVADFGLSKILGNDIHMHTVCGTPSYCAPEVMCGNKYDQSVDMWSIGVITYILLCGYEPFYDVNEKQMYRNILTANYQFHPEEWSGISENAKDFVTKMLDINPKTRLTSDKALKHPWVTGRGAKNEHMTKAHDKIKVFNASRKMKAITDATILATRAGRLAQSLNTQFLSNVSDVTMKDQQQEQT